MPHSTNSNDRPAPRKRFGPKGSPDAMMPNRYLGYKLNRLCTFNESPEGALVGLEFEWEPQTTWHMQNAELPNRPNRNVWIQDADGSLRDRGREYILNGPQPLENTLTALTDLSEWVAGLRGGLRTDSTRTSTHVHLNAQELTPVQVTNFACLWYVIEEAYSLTLPASRQGNLFALRACDTQRGFKEVFKQSLSDPRSFVHSFPESQRYGALNLAAIGKFGSLEMRMLPGMAEPLDVVPHLMAYIQIHEVCQTFEDPLEIITSFSGYGPEGFVRRYMPKMWALIADLDENPRYRALYQGMRYSQEIASIMKTWRSTDDTTDEGEDVMQPSEPQRVEDWTGTPYTPPEPHESHADYSLRRFVELGYDVTDTIPDGVIDRVYDEWLDRRDPLVRQTQDVQGTRAHIEGEPIFNTPMDNAATSREWLEEFHTALANHVPTPPPSE